MTRLTLEERTSLIATYGDGHRVVVEALSGATPEELDRSYPGEWSARQVLHHLADSETFSYGRIRTILADDNAVIHAYDEAEFARRLSYDRPIELSLTVLGAVRAATVELLELLTEAQWARTGTHTESGEYGAERWLEIYAAHAHDHAEQIKRARRGEK